MACVFLEVISLSAELVYVKLAKALFTAFFTAFEELVMNFKFSRYHLVCLQKLKLLNQNIFYQIEGLLNYMLVLDMNDQEIKSNVEDLI